MFVCAALFCTSPGPPEAPSAPTALEFGTSNLTVGWHPPAHDGGSPVTTFRLEVLTLPHEIAIQIR